MYLIINNSKLGLKYRVKIIENPNLECIYDCDTLLFNINLKNIVFRVILCHVIADCIDELVN